MSERVTVVIPVKDGARFLGEVLHAVAREGVDDVLVIDSGSTDGSQGIARAAGATVLEIAPDQFGHGRTRNLGAERASGDVIAFLTQDATPAPGWLDAIREGLALSADVGVVFGPHRARPETSPMIARELTDFFATFGDAPHIYTAEQPVFLSNVNAAYRRACWEEIQFDDVPYSEDQAFGRAVAAHPRWRKAYHPAAAVLHAHDYGAAQFMRRYFDEYRGLRETIDHVEPLAPRSSLLGIRNQVAADRRFMREHEIDDIARWTARSVVHHSGRKAFAVLGSRARALPPQLQRTLSLEGNAGAPNVPVLKHRAASQPRHRYEIIERAKRTGPAPLLAAYPGMADRERLHIAWIIPTFNIGSGGHYVIFQIIERLERMGHTCSIWVHDAFGAQPEARASMLRRDIVEHFAPVKAPVFLELDDWYGADVAVATGWQTVYPTLELPGCRARAYMVNDHEPEFFPTSVEHEWAASTYSLGLYGVVASPWLRDLYVNRYGGEAGTFQYGVDKSVYYPRRVRRRRDTVIAYARVVTPRRAVALAFLGLAELKRRRPDARIVLFGNGSPPEAPFEYEDAGVAGHEQLAWLFSEATAGLCLSLTNYSLVPREMLACGLPCVELDRPGTRSVFAAGGPVALAEFNAASIADELEQLLDDEAEWERRSDAGLDWVKDQTWDVSAEQVERELRNALRVRGG
jgi:glycosyltransferase involved in cell wall biosynthesis